MHAQNYSEILLGCGVKDAESVKLCRFLLRLIFNDDSFPESGMAGREIRRMAGVKLNSPLEEEFRRASRGQRCLLAGTFQKVRGNWIVPVGQHRGRIPEPEIDYAVGVLFFHLGERGLSARRRWSCIAELLSSNPTFPVSKEAVQKRLGRRSCQEYNCETEYKLALWKAGLAAFPLKQKAPKSWAQFLKEEWLSDGA